MNKQTTPLPITTYADMVDNSKYFQADVVEGKFMMPSYLAKEWLDNRETVIVIDNLTKQKCMLTGFELHAGISDNKFKQAWQKGRYANIEMEFMPENMPVTENSKWSETLLNRFHYSWFELMKDYLFSEEFRTLNNQANTVARKTKTIFPLKENVYKMFSHDIMKTRVVLLGQD